MNRSLSTSILPCSSSISRLWCNSFLRPRHLFELLKLHHGRLQQTASHGSSRFDSCPSLSSWVCNLPNVSVQPENKVLSTVGLCLTYLWSDRKCSEPPNWYFEVDINADTHSVSSSVVWIRLGLWSERSTTLTISRTKATKTNWLKASKTPSQSQQKP